MKRKFYICILFTFSGFLVCFSQNKLKVGINLGGQISSLRDIENEADKNFSLIPTIGVNIEVPLSSSISVVTGINFERWKKKRDFTLFDPFSYPEGETSYKEGYDFYNIPLLIRYKFGNKKDFFIDGGAFVNYFNKGRPNRRYGSLFIQFEDYNFGAVFGVGKDFKITNKIHLALQLRDEFGLTDVNKYEWEVSGEAKTNTIRMLATLSYEL